MRETGTLAANAQIKKKRKPKIMLIKSKLIKKLLTAVACSFLLLLNSVDCFGQTITWQKTYGSLSINEGFSIVQTPDGGYLAVGRDRTGQIEKTWVLRLDQYGDTLWAKFLMFDIPIKIIETNDNNYVIMGAFTSIIKIDINGNLLWQSGPYDDDKIFNSIKQTFDDGYLVCGLIEDGPIRYPYLFKISNSGDSLWEKIYTTNIFDGRFGDFVLDNFGNCVLTGSMSDSAFISSKLFLMKTDNTGNVIWLNRVDTLIYQIVRSVTKTPDHSYIVAGSINRPFAAKFDSTGNLIWYKRYYSTESSYGGFHSVTIASDNNYIFTGTLDTTTNFDDRVLLLKTDVNGNVLWRSLYGENYSNEVKETSDSGFVIIGLMGGIQNGLIYIIKTDKNGYADPPIGIEPVGEIIPSEFRLYQNYPNPFNPETFLKFGLPVNGNIKISLFDVLGRQITVLLNDYKQMGIFTMKLNTSNFKLASGVYFVILENSNGIKLSQKIILLK